MNPNMAQSVAHSAYSDLETGTFISGVNIA